MANTVRAGAAQMAGNGIILDVTRDDDGWRVIFASEPRTSPQPLWFHIEVTGLDGDGLHMVWENADLALGNRNELSMLRPVLRADGGSWHRCSNVEVEDTEDGRRRVHFHRQPGADTVAAALCYPYVPADLEATLEELPGAWETTVIGVTGHGRPLTRLRSPRAGEVEGAMGLYVVARQHAGETPGSWVLDGLLRFVAADSEEAVAFREQVDCWVVPFADLDGVVEGDYGKDAMPWDFNRAWEPMPMRPEVQAMQHDLQRFAERCRPGLIIDLHAPGHATSDVYLQMPRDERPAEQHESARRFAEQLAERVPEVPAESLTRPTRYPSRWNAMATLGSWAWDHLGGATEVSIETSYQRLADRLLEPTGYRALGRRVARAALAWLRKGSTG